MMVLAKLIITFIAALIIIYTYFKYVLFNYWRKRGVFYIDPVVPTGNIGSLVTKKVSIGEFFYDLYVKYKDHRAFGIYAFFKPNLIITDPELIRVVLTKEFKNFHDRGVFCNEKIDPLTGHLFALSGRKWRNLRVKMTPTFTSGKLKHMFAILKMCGKELVSNLESVAQTEDCIKIKDWFGRYTTDTVMSTAFGVNSNCIEEGDNEFRQCGNKIFNVHPFWIVLNRFTPQILNFFSIPMIDRGVTKFLTQIFQYNVEYRQTHNISKHDFMNLLIQLMEKGYVKPDNDDIDKSSPTNINRLTLLQAAAQAFVFFAAGFETTSTTATFCLYELAQQQDMQDKLRKEIDEILKKHGELTYNAVNEMTYLHKVINETMRKYPPLPILNRICTEEITLPTTNIHVPKGMAITIPILGLQRDPSIYPDPDKFDPERFNEDKVAARHSYAYLPFGKGPRACIAMRFGYIQTKVGIVSLLSKFKFKLNPRTTVPIVFDPKNIVLEAKNDIYLTIEPRQESDNCFYFKCPHRKKSRGVKFGDLGGHSIAPLLPIHLCGMVLLHIMCYQLDSEVTMVLAELITIVIVALIIIYTYSKYILFNYWRKKSVFYVEPVVPTGNIGSLLTSKVSVGEFFYDLYVKYKDHRAFGIYTFFKPNLVITDPDLIRAVLTKEFKNFHDRGFFCNEKVDPLTGHLIALSGKKWRNLRVKLTPTFTSGKIKQMFAILKLCGEELVSSLESVAQTGDRIEIKDWFGRYSTDIIMSTAFGVKSNCIEEGDNEFRYWGKTMFEEHPFWSVLSAFMPQVLVFFSIPFLDRGVTKFFTQIFQNNVKYRQTHNIVKYDFMNLLIQLMEKGYVEPDDVNIDESSPTNINKLTLLEAAAQAFVFFAAGFETASTTATFCLYELAQQPDLQDKICKEIDEILKKHGELTYNAVNEMTYLHKVINGKFIVCIIKLRLIIFLLNYLYKRIKNSTYNQEYVHNLHIDIYSNICVWYYFYNVLYIAESLRKYPPVPILNRICTEEVTLPTTNIHVPKGMAITIPILGLQRDPSIYPDPDKFDPERFNEDKVAARHPYTFLPFGEGPRICIGSRFGYVQTKVGLVSLLSKFKFKLDPRTTVPIIIDKKSFVLAAKDGIYLTIEPRK
ncbi:uncharacterized protein [Anoplolepis gracilipes]|uniref:uncharacterized protein n=1 Tax=Anoplolepis gracilipes TaxID=354296 RepID=UPI003BA1462D